MSLKYHRVKQADLKLPAPLRWLTRAFSSITMAVILLTLVALYGVIASVPVAFLAKAGLYAMSALGGVGVAVVLAVVLARHKRLQTHWGAVWGLSGVLVSLGAWLSLRGAQAIHTWADQHPWFQRHHATIIYRLRFFEMTELEFYCWWPLKLILGLFVCNLIWATIRRIEFRFVNIGVLTVHTGIVLIAAGSIVYGWFKVEGDTILWRRDLGGRPVADFYDATTPAIYFFTAQGEKFLMIPLHHLPRYNDYDPDRGELDIRLHDWQAFRDCFGPHVRATIRGLISYGSMQWAWVDQGNDPAADKQAQPLAPNPALRLGFGDQAAPRQGFEHVLVASSPADRVLKQPDWELEYLVNPTPQRLADLTAPLDGPHGLIIEIPHQNPSNDSASHHPPYRQIESITPGQTITVGQSGYTLTIESIGDYGIGFVSPGYERATDTRAVVRISNAQRTFRRIVFHRYPERNQDFVPAPDDPSVGPIGRRTDPDPAIRLAYIDASKLQYHLISNHPNGKADQLKIMIRLPNAKSVFADMPKPQFPVVDPSGRTIWAHITQRLTHATRVRQPIPTPQPNRRPNDEGTYLHTLLPVDFEIVSPDSPNSGRPTWHRRVWLPHMRYPMYPDEDHAPVKLSLPPALPGTRPEVAAGSIQAAFSRLERPLPFVLSLEAFEMQPYPGSQIPRDYVADLAIADIDRSSESVGPTSYGQARLNNPLVYQGIKLSQTGWDPGDRNAPNHAERDAHGRFLNQQRYTILGVGNNMGIRVIFVGACLVVAGIPWAFYIKPLLVRVQKRKLQAQLANPTQPAPSSTRGGL